jgi:hypothetical protein
MPDLPQLGPMQGTPYLNPAYAPQVPAGKPRPFGPGEYFMNQQGSWSNEISATVQDPALNGGKPTVVPTLWVINGQAVRVDEDTAAKYAAQSGLPFRSFESEDSANQFADQRESNWQNVDPSKAGSLQAVPPLWVDPSVVAQRNAQNKAAVATAKGGP